MDIAEMHYHIDQGLQKNASFVYGNFLEEEIDAFINKMQNRFIKDRFDKSDNEELGFEAIQKRMDDIRVLVTPVSTPLSVDDQGDMYANLEMDYMFYISGEGIGTLIKDDCVAGDMSEEEVTEEKIPLNMVKLTSVPARKQNPFKKSSPEVGVMATMLGNVIKVYPSKRFILTGLFYYYIRIPSQVSLSSQQNCELAMHTHDEIVDLTVQHILEVTQSPRYQSNSAQARKME